MSCVYCYHIVHVRIHNQSVFLQADLSIICFYLIDDFSCLSRRVRNVFQAVERLCRSAMKEEVIPDNLLVLSCEEDHEVCIPFLEKGEFLILLLCLLINKKLIVLNLNNHANPSLHLQEQQCIVRNSC